MTRAEEEATYYVRGDLRSHGWSVVADDQEIATVIGEGSAMVAQAAALMLNTPGYKPNLSLLLDPTKPDKAHVRQGEGWGWPERWEQK